jgi:F0F1-type ATP synthase membrane subunit a
VTTGIVVLVLLVRAVPQPWRGIIDLGVVVGLAWGIISIVVFSIQAFFSDTFDYSPDVPDEVKA